MKPRGQLAALLITLLAVSPSATATPQPAVFRYQNPIGDGIDPFGLRDCHVFRDGDRWYMTGTAWPVWPREDKFGRLNPGVVLYSSEDLLHWKYETVLVRPNPERWYFMRFWAPEIRKLNGKYYASFSCRNPAVLGDTTLRVGYAVSNNLKGPYTVRPEPLAEGNDLTFFENDDAIWAFWNATMEPGADKARVREFGIHCAPVDLETGGFLAAPVRAITTGRLGKDWDGVGIEGSCVLKRNGVYYLFYSSWTRGYEIGYATARDLGGPWTKHPGNPIYGGQDKLSCKRSGTPHTGDEANEYSHIGHNSVFTGPDGRIWLSCHGILKSDPKAVPFLVLEPLDFDDAGNISISKPSTQPRNIRIE